MTSTTRNTLHSANPRMLVVVHDCSSAFLSELSHIAERLHPILGWKMSAAIVPRWHGHLDCRSNVAYHDLVMQFSERLLHGWTHQSSTRLRPLSLLTNCADEFSRLDETTILARLESAQADFRDLTGRNAEGFLPPAWQFPIRASRLPSLKFVMRFGCLQSCQSERRNQPLATSSWDWGRLSLLGYPGEWIGRLRQRIHQSAIPCIAIHPVDVRRGHFDRAVRLIETLKRRGYHPVTASELMLAQETCS